MFSYEEVSSEVQDRMKAPIFNSKFIKLKYNDPDPVLKNFTAEYCFLPEHYTKYAKRIKEFKVRDDDIWILSYLKCGTTWTMELVWLMANGMDFETAKSVLSVKRVLYLEQTAFGHLGPDKIDEIDQVSHRRIIKSHLPINLLPNELWKSKAKIVYVARNPKDAAISYFHHGIGLKQYAGTLDVFLEEFLNGNVLYGSYFQHVNQFWQLAKLKENFLFITFEEMKMDMMKVLGKVDEFLETGHSEEKLKELEEYLKFENIREVATSNMSYVHLRGPEKVNKDFVFIRKGQVESFKEEMPVEFQRKFDEEIIKWNGVGKLFKSCLKNI